MFTNNCILCTIHAIVHAFHAIIIRHIIQNNAHYCPKFIHIDEYITIGIVVRIVQWSDISHFASNYPKISAEGIFLSVEGTFFCSKSFVKLLILRISSHKTSILFPSFTSFKLQKCTKYKLPQIHHIKNTVIVKYYGVFSMLHIV